MFPRDNAKRCELAKYSAPAPHETIQSSRRGPTWARVLDTTFILVGGISLRERSYAERITDTGTRLESDRAPHRTGDHGHHVLRWPWPSYQTLAARVQARSATVEIASELRLARQLAMARRERLRVIFDREGRTITLRRADAEGILHVYQYADKGVVVEEPTAGPELLFHPSGRSVTPTTIRVRDSQGRETTFTVNITGRVSVS